MFGVLAGSATLTGGPATGLAFAPLFEEAGLVGAESIAITSAMARIVCGGIVVGPAIPLLIRRLRLQPGKDQATTVPRSGEHTSELQSLMPTTYDVFHLKKKLHITLINRLDNIH